MEENVNTTFPTGRTVAIRYGLLFALISIVYFLVFTITGMDMSRGLGQWGTTLIAFVMVFLAHKYFKENGDGFMSYGQGVGIAFWLGLISSVISGVFTYIYIKFIDSQFITTIREKAIEDMQNKGQTDDQIEFAMKYVEMFTSAEAILLMGVIIGIITLIFVGLLVSIFTQKQNPQPSF